MEIITSNLQKILDFGRNHKTEFCKHELSCIHFFLRSSIQNFSQGFLIRLSLGLIFSLKQILKNPKLLQKTLFSQSNFQIGIFTWLISSFSNFLICLMRKIRQKDDLFTYFIPGAVSGGIAIQLQPQANWYHWRMAFFARVFDCVYLALANRGYYSTNGFHYTLMYAIGSIFLSYTHFQERNICLKDVDQLYLSFSSLTPNEVQWHNSVNVWNEHYYQTYNLNQKV